ncbi:MAG: hypothetical protein HY075_03485, partial [Deltaproteobacteria bacterium]|nr:hypothetical protein [Deltaproteobacteria bacterium]
MRTQGMFGVVFSLVVFVSGVAQAAPPAPQRATLTQVRGVWVMNLYGTRTEMARQHGELIRDRLKETTLPFFAEKIHNAINNTYIVKDMPFLGGVLRGFIDFWVTRPLRNKLPKEDRQLYVELAKAAGFPVDEALNAAVVPDVGQWLTSNIFKGNGVLKGSFGNLGFGCSSLVIAQKDGFVHARNLDYESYGIFDRNPAVIYFHPSEPGAQSYTSISSLGIHTAGITATNASGITLGLHQLFVNATSRSHTPILVTTERVIREARTLDQALAILNHAKYAGSWAVVLSSAREGRAAVVEVSDAGVDVRRMDGDHIVQTNHVFGANQKKSEFNVSYGSYRSTRGR